MEKKQKAAHISSKDLFSKGPVFLKADATLSPLTMPMEKDLWATYNAS